MFRVLCFGKFSASVRQVFGRFRLSQPFSTNSSRARKKYLRSLCIGVTLTPAEVALHRVLIYFKRLSVRHYTNRPTLISICPSMNYDTLVSVWRTSPTIHPTQKYRGSIWYRCPNIRLGSVLLKCIGSQKNRKMGKIRKYYTLTGIIIDRCGVSNDDSQAKCL